MKNKKRKTTQEKQAIIAEAKEKGWVATARKHGINYPTLQDWIRRLEAGGESALSGNFTASIAEYKKLMVENQRLKEIVADKELEIKINAEFLKKDIPQAERKMIAEQFINQGFCTSKVLKLCEMPKSSFYAKTS